MLSRKGLIPFLIIGYLIIFYLVSPAPAERAHRLKVPLPVIFHKVTAGYFYQIVSELLFIKTSVFLGGLNPDTPEDEYAAPLAENLQIMTALYPRFQDPYYFSQSFLTSISSNYAEMTNEILRRGIQSYPENLFFRFFHAFNFYQYLNAPLKAAKAFNEAANLPNSPPMFRHLAAIFSAEGGNVTSGFLMLKAMEAIEKNDKVRARYQEELHIFSYAIRLQEAVYDYVDKHSCAPEHLEKLVPEYIDSIVYIFPGFHLEYTPPIISLLRMRK